IEGNAIVIEVPPGHRHWLEPIELIPRIQGFGPVEELVTGHGWGANGDAHRVYITGERAVCPPISGGAISGGRSNRREFLRHHLPHHEFLNLAGDDHRVSAHEPRPGGTSHFTGVP